MTEEFRDISWCPNTYEISNFGRVRNKKTYFIRKNWINTKGYEHITLTKESTGKSYRQSIHILVAEAFIPNPENKLEVNHIDGNKLNNRVDNLERCTRIENMNHARSTGLCDNLEAKRFYNKLKELKEKHDFVLVNEVINYLEEMLDKKTNPFLLRNNIRI